ncbi:zf-HC2 domain-containing protein [Lysinibacillus xylanilyticus]|uniref:zf-HC2 domain-containing protein n=1 Tax=Lysinibacillus xylanilyticus TaxID=582475 RepID=UPI002B24B3C1|nr:zf-HC2 domain-containing protein [Lysinibacillus xylanilyticus]MEB2282043.1 zf-HC2 domain-containing protein [Lysinibacillus xylanilyticus]
MSQNCSIVEDLLPLYKKQVLQATTVKFVEQHLTICEHCQQLATSKQSLGYHLLMKRTITLFHLVFIVLSFMFAINSSLLGNQTSFAISYAIFGCLTYFFYKNIWIVFAISSVPVFVWAIINNINNSLYVTHYSLTEIGTLLIGASFIATLHTIFALFGAAFAILFRRFTK